MHALFLQAQEARCLALLDAKCHLRVHGFPVSSAAQVKALDLELSNAVQASPMALKHQPVMQQPAESSKQGLNRPLFSLGNTSLECPLWAWHCNDCVEVLSSLKSL